MKLESTAFLADPELLRALKERATEVDCSQDRLLFNQGEPAVGLYILLKGVVDLTMRAEDGNLVVSVSAAAGSLLGLPAVIGNEGYSLSAMAKRGAEVGFVNRDDFSRMMLTEPGLSGLILRVLAAEVRTARRALAER